MPSFFRSSHRLCFDSSSPVNSCFSTNSYCRQSARKLGYDQTETRHTLVVPNMIRYLSGVEQQTEQLACIKVAREDKVTEFLALWWEWKGVKSRGMCRCAFY